MPKCRSQKNNTEFEENASGHTHCRFFNIKITTDPEIKSRSMSKVQIFRMLSKYLDCPNFLLIFAYNSWGSPNRFISQDRRGQT